MEGTMKMLSQLHPWITTVSCAALVACGAAGSTPQADANNAADAEGAQLKHVFLIMMENHGTDEIIGNTVDAPYINSLANQYGVATNYYGVTHPSLPNYLATISGDFQGIWDDCKAGADVTCAPEEFVQNNLPVAGAQDSGDATDTLLLTAAEYNSASSAPHWFSGKNLVDQLESNQLTWKAYMQSLPAAGSTVEYWPVDSVDGGASVPRKLYAQKHDPFMYFSDIRNDPGRMQRIVPLTQLDDDLASDGLPNFVWISPDQCHDMHGVSPANAAAVGIPDCAYPASGLDHKIIALGDQFLSDTVKKIMASHAWQQDAIILILWDEDDYAGYAGCCGSPTTTGGAVLGGARAPALVITSKKATVQTDAHPYNHYSLLATLQKVWDLGCLANTCNFTDADLMTHLFRP
jgi:hypothetical protein